MGPTTVCHIIHGLWSSRHTDTTPMMIDFHVLLYVYFYTHKITVIYGRAEFRANALASRTRNTLAIEHLHIITCVTHSLSVHNSAYLSWHFYCLFLMFLRCSQWTWNEIVFSFMDITAFVCDELMKHVFAVRRSLLISTYLLDFIVYNFELIFFPKNWPLICYSIDVPIAILCQKT